MFSATYSDDIRQLAGRILRNPASIEVSARNATAERVDQQVYRVPKDHKRHLLAHLIDAGNWHQVLVFTRTKHGANRLAQQLESSGIRSAAIHGNKSQGARVRALSDFKANKVTALVATEVAARGLDIKELPHVVNYELPNVPEDYVHRIGRTARAGGSGSAVSLVSPDETPLLKDIERMLKRVLPVTALPEFQIIATPAGAPRGGNGSTEDRASERRGGGGGRHSARHGGGGGRNERSGRHGNGGGDRGRPAHAGQGHTGHAGRGGSGNGQSAPRQHGGGDQGVPHQHGGGDRVQSEHAGQGGNGGGQGAPAQHADHSTHRGDGGTRGRSDPQRHNHGGGGQARPGQPSRRFSSGGGGGGQRHRTGGGRSTGRR
jgi:ATP-dependent RNA helicase RhlE